MIHFLFFNWQSTVKIRRMKINLNLLLNYKKWHLFPPLCFIYISHVQRQISIESRWETFSSLYMLQSCPATFVQLHWQWREVSYLIITLAAGPEGGERVNSSNAIFPLAALAFTLLSRQYKYLISAPCFHRCTDSLIHLHLTLQLRSFVPKEWRPHLLSVHEAKCFKACKYLPLLRVRVLFFPSNNEEQCTAGHSGWVQQLTTTQMRWEEWTHRDVGVFVISVHQFTS